MDMIYGMILVLTAINAYMFFKRGAHWLFVTGVFILVTSISTQLLLPDQLQVYYYGGVSLALCGLFFGLFYQDYRGHKVKMGEAVTVSMWACVFMVLSVYSL
jgi:vacuolar-type H+-ATPase subunit I/STV1